MGGNNLPPVSLTISGWNTIVVVTDFRISISYILKWKTIKHILSIEKIMISGIGRNDNLYLYMRWFWDRYSFFLIFAKCVKNPSRFYSITGLFSVYCVCSGSNNYVFKFLSFDFSTFKFLVNWWKNGKWKYSLMETMINIKLKHDEDEKENIWMNKHNFR